MIKILLDAVDVSESVDSCTIDDTQNERSTATLRLQGVYPDVDDEAIVYAKNGTTPIFGGLVGDYEIDGVSDNSLADVVTVPLVSWERFTEWCSVSLSYPVAVALEDVIEDMVDQVLGDYGLTYAPAATGVMLAPFTWVDVPCDEAIRQLRDRIDQIIRFNPDKSITVEATAATAALFSITDANRHRLGSFTVGAQDRERANVVKMRFGPTGTLLTTQRWEADGVATSWVTDIPATSPAPALVLIDDGVSPFLATVGAGGQFEWDVTTNAPYGTLSVGTASTPADGTAIVLGPSIAEGDPFETDGFWGVYPFAVTRTTGGAPPREYRDSRPDVTAFGAAVEITEQALARLDRSDARKLGFSVIEEGFGVNQALTVNTTARGGVVGDFLIESMNTTIVKGDYREYVLTATEGEEAQRTTQGEWREMTSGRNAGGGGSISVASAAATVLSSPFPLGGSRENSWPVGTVGAPVIDWMPFIAQADMSVRVRAFMKVRDAAVEATPILQVYDGGTMAWVTHQSGAGSSSTTGEEQTFITALSAGEQYRLWHVTDAAAGSSFCIGQLENLT